MTKTLQELAASVGGQVKGNPKAAIRRVAAIVDAGPGDLAFVSNPKYVNRIATTKATAVIVPPALAREEGNFLICANPYLAFARIAAIFGPLPPRPEPGVHPTAVVHPTARLGAGVSVGPHATIEARCVVGDEAVLMAGVYLGQNVEVGAQTVLHPNVCVYHGCRLGKRVVVHANTVIGSDGFGFAPDGERYEPIPQTGVAIVHDDVSIGASSVVNRGALNDTVIGQGCKIDSCCVISHGVRLGPHCLIVSQVGISGSVTVGRNVTLAGQVGVAGHLTIGDGARVSGKSAVVGDLAPGRDYMGIPARPMAQAQRVRALTHRLPALQAQIKALTKEVEELKKRAASPAPPLP
ncbi:MAG TPA: UDP-3-O-(3-hydroxymyristoyl)glucosamine N-acyltransferase [Candidatus Brocadiia bacterium]|nr:UDP-3-O-(3-hydroxymyristoyl)glucosamine N-acyltransferase [Candidatus Brocadiia bacterium]